MGVGGILGGVPPGPLPEPAAGLPRLRPQSAAQETAQAASPPEGPAPARAGPIPSETQAREAARVIEDFPIAARAGVRLRIDKANNRIVAQIIGSNNEVIKQIPPEELLKVIARVRDLAGLLFDRQA